MYPIGSKPGKGTYRCVGCNTWTVTLDAGKKLPPCGICSKGHKTLYRKISSALDVLQQSLGPATLAGVTGTGAMTVLAMIGPLMGLPEMNVPAMLSGFMGRVFGPAWAAPVVGWVAHFTIGIALAFLYAFTLGNFRGNPWLKGMLYGLFPWLLAQLAVMPLMGMGVFTANAPHAPLLVSMSLMGHLVYGLFVGGLFGNPERHLLVTAKAGA